MKLLSIQKNQNAARDAINIFVERTNNYEDKTKYLIMFTKFLAGQLLIRIESDDCYLIDMLEDIENIE